MGWGTGSGGFRVRLEVGAGWAPTLLVSYMKQNVDHVSYKIKLNNTKRSLILFIFDAPFSVTFLFLTHKRCEDYFCCICISYLLRFSSQCFFIPRRNSSHIPNNMRGFICVSFAPFVFCTCCGFLIPPGNIPPNEAHLIFRTM